MSPKLTLALVLTASAIFAQGQSVKADSITNSYHIFFPAMGRDILAARVGAHRYKIINNYNKPAEVYVDDKIIAESELAKYQSILARIQESVKDNDEDREMRQMERDRRQADRDEQQASRDRERQREQQQRDRDQQQRDREQQQRDREQQQRDRDQASNACNCDQDGWSDEQVEQQRTQAAEDRSMLKKGIQVLVDDHIIASPKSLRSLVLTDSDIAVNGIKQSPGIYQQMRSKLGDWAPNGFTYGTSGPSDDYSLSVN